jgi:hypothetical protein
MMTRFVGGIFTAFGILLVLGGLGVTFIFGLNGYPHTEDWELVPTPPLHFGESPRWLVTGLKQEEAAQIWGLYIGLGKHHYYFYRFDTGGIISIPRPPYDDYRGRGYVYDVSTDGEGGILVSTRSSWRVYYYDHYGSDVFHYDLVNWETKLRQAESTRTWHWAGRQVGELAASGETAFIFNNWGVHRYDWVTGEVLAQELALSSPTAVWAADGWVYFESGDRNWYRLDPITLAAEPRAKPPYDLASGVLVAHGKYIYALRGNDKPDIARYDTSTDTWETVFHLPVNTGWNTVGFAIHNNRAYCLTEGGLYRYKYTLPAVPTIPTLRYEITLRDHWELGVPPSDITVVHHKQGPLTVGVVEFAPGDIKVVTGSVVNVNTLVRLEWVSGVRYVEIRDTELRGVEVVEVGPTYEYITTARRIPGGWLLTPDNSRLVLRVVGLEEWVPPKEAYDVHGVVTIDNQGELIYPEGIRIELDGLEALTNSEGQFTIADVAPGDYTLRVRFSDWHENLPDAEQSITVDQDCYVEAKIRIVRYVEGVPEYEEPELEVGAWVPPEVPEILRIEWLGPALILLGLFMIGGGIAMTRAGIRVRGRF